MKRNILILSIVAGAIIIVFSCSKEMSNNFDTGTSKNNQLTEYEIQVNKSIKDFKQKMAYCRENPHLKSGETIPADSAVWLLEATINFSHAFPNEYS
ncbi:MAG: hypothetical protein R2764_15995 [Bacteroidales bacterium]